MLQLNIGFTLRRVLVVFTRSAITPLKVNRFEWNLEHSEYIVGAWPWQIWDAISPVVTAVEPGEILFIFGEINNARFQLFSVAQISRNLNRTHRLVRQWKLSEQNLKNFTTRDHFFLNVQNLNILQLQAAITPQWLQIARNSLANYPSCGMYSRQMQEVNILCTDSWALQAEYCIVTFHTIQPSRSCYVLAP